MRFQSYFYPRSPCGERQAEQPLPTATIAISIHALLAESDNAANDDEQNTFVFLSTLSLRRATSRYTGGAAAIHNFYPRSPCGERRKHQRQGAGGERISIHALLAESDAGCASGNPARRPFLSTLSLRRATGVPFSRLAYDYKFLSTLSLRRATCGVCWMSLWMRYFYPRSPCGERRTKTALTSTVLNFYPRSPCGERHLPQRNCAAGAKFLSTLSLRRATITLKEYAFRHGNFYPRSPCGERRFSFWRCTAQRIFLSTLSLRRATLPGGDRPRHAGISIHALLAESDPRSRWVPRHTQISIHALLAESDGKLAAVITGNGAFLSTLSLRRATQPLTVI